MWFDKLPPDTPWSNLWSQYIRCPTCSGIRTGNDLCPVCGNSLDVSPESIILDSGKEVTVHRAFRGGETRYEDYVYLQILEREWKRPDRSSASKGEFPFLADVSSRAAIVLVFWSYFESKNEYLLRNSLGHIPAEFMEDMLKRYSSISARLKDLYKITFRSTYYQDLCSVGFGDVKDRLIMIRERRNSFAHGSPKSIDDVVVEKVVEFLEREHVAWIAVYNWRVASQRELFVRDK